MNCVQLIGRLTADPELRHTNNGTSVTDLRLAVDGRGDNTDFVTVTAWSRTAEVVSEHLTKGRQVAVSGRLQVDQWTDTATGDNRERIRVVAHDIDFLDAPKKNNETQRHEQTQAASTTPATTAPPALVHPVPEARGAAR